MSIIRLDRYLADVHIGSRKFIREYIRDGRIRIGDRVVTRPDTRLNTETDTVSFDGKELTYSNHRYYMLNKPAGVVSATRDGLSSTVIDLLSGISVRGLSPVGRLDKDTEGLLLITDDGQLAHTLLSPKREVQKCYEVHLASPLPAEALEKLKNGVDIGDDTPTLPAEAEYVGEDQNGHEIIRLTIHEGRFHQVKRMISVCGSEVVYLKRLSMGALKLDPYLKPGTFRALSADEIMCLKKDVIHQKSSD